MSFLQLRSSQLKFVLAQYPSVTTNAVSNINATTTDGNGTVNSAGGSAVSARGFVWSSSTLNPTLADSSVSAGSGTGAFTATMNGLTASTTYYYRAYATNSIGTAYGDMISFVTAAQGATLYNSTLMMMGMGM
jgi:hypothetical protein